MVAPGAPPPSRRLDAVERLNSEGIMVGVRVLHLYKYDGELAREMWRKNT
jgi:DNA repair photolyase